MSDKFLIPMVSLELGIVANESKIAGSSVGSVYSRLARTINVSLLRKYARLNRRAALKSESQSFPNLTTASSRAPF